MVLAGSLNKRSTVRISLAAAISALLAGCGGMGSGCSEVEMNTTPNAYVDTLTDITIRNTSNEPKLVTLAFVESDGSELETKSIRVDAKDIEEGSFNRMGNGRTIELVSCE